MKKYPVLIIFLFISLNIFADNNIIGTWYDYPFSAEITILENLDFTIYARSPVENGYINGTLTKINDDNYLSFLSNDGKNCLMVLRYKGRRDVSFGEEIIEVEMSGDRIDNANTVSHRGRYSKDSMSEEEYIYELERNVFIDIYHLLYPEQIFKELLQEDYKYSLEIFLYSDQYMDSYITMQYNNDWYNRILKIDFKNEKEPKIYY
jgi:hypothetical protein